MMDGQSVFCVVEMKLPSNITNAAKQSRKWDSEKYPEAHKRGIVALLQLNN